MNPILRNILAVIAGWIIGSFINMALINTGHAMYPIDGVSPDDFEAYKAAVPTLELKHFVFPWLAHAVGTLVGALIAGLIAGTNKMKMALIVGVVFLIGGIIVNIMLKSPLWFTAADIALAYIPMAWIGGKIALAFSKK